MNEILRLLPDKLKQAVSKKVSNEWGKLEEIRLRLNKPIELNFYDRIEWIVDSIFTAQHSIYVLNQLSEYSLYRMETELREGFITIEGGHRVGLAGEVSTENGMLKQIQHITFFNIRIAREINNIATPYLPYLQHSRAYYNTLIIGAPQTGKTTILRDIARLISDGFSPHLPKKVAIIDERSEIAASRNGIPQHNIGKRTDVLDACPKFSGMMIMIRSMSPEVLIVDEIGKEQDVHALMEAIFSGVTIICTVHGNSVEELYKRPSLFTLFQYRVFQRYIVLHNIEQNRIRITIHNEEKNVILSNVVKKR